MLIIYFVLIVLFILLSGFFSGMETGLISLDKIKLEKESRNSKTKKRILNFLDKPDKMLGTTLIGTNIAIVIVSSLSVLFADLLIYQSSVKINKELVPLITSFAILLFAEIIPKSIYRERANILVPKTFSLVTFFYILLKPFVAIISILNKTLTSRFKLPEENQYIMLTRDDIHYLLTENEDEVELEEEQREMLVEALEFNELKARNVMIPRTDLIALEDTTPVPEILKIAREEGYTRFPVYEDTQDKIIGILIIYDLLKHKDTSGMTAKDFVRAPYFVPETMDAVTLLREMQSRRITMTIIVDSYGGTAGLVTIEDILEEIVGEIEDEYDEDIEKDIEVISDGVYIVQGYVDVDDLNDLYDLDLPESSKYQTIAGLIINELSRIPTQGQKLTINGWRVQILNVTRRKISKVKISRLPDTN